jgi:16S rRNA (guanine527-N7)-methyltransferase
MSAVGEHLLAGLDVSRETWGQLETFAALVRRWTVTVNLVSRGSVQDLWDRHIVDSAQLFGFCPANARHWADLGSGGGLPGMVVAILAREFRPDLLITLVESDQRKAAFLRQAAQSLGLAPKIHSERIESLAPLDADVISARALAPLTELLALSKPHLRPEGIGLFPKGSRFREEIEEARRTWSFDVDCHPSQSQPEAAVLIIRKIERARQS